MKIYLIRHGQTLWNKEGRWQGSTDIELDEVGHMQAEKAAMRLKNSGITAVYSSPLKRARLTADIIFKGTGISPVLDPELREVSLGQWEGLGLIEIREKYPEYLHMWESEPETAMGLGVENYGMLRDRAVKAVYNIAGNHKSDDVIAIVGHGAWIRAFVLHVMCMPMTKRLCFNIDNTGISIVDYCAENNLFRVSALNDCCHLDDI